MMSEQQVSAARSGLTNRAGNAAELGQQPAAFSSQPMQVVQGGTRPNMNVLVLRHDSSPASGYVLVQQGNMSQGGTVIRPGTAVNMVAGQQVYVRAPGPAQFNAASGAPPNATATTSIAMADVSLNGTTSTASSDGSSGSPSATTGGKRGANAASGTSNELIVKCNQFFNTLLQLASQQSKATHEAVRNLAQTLIDGKINAQTFTARLQEQLNSTPQPNLVPFLEKTLPAFRAQLSAGSMNVDGIRAPADQKAAASPSGLNGVDGESAGCSSKSLDKLSDTFSAVISDAAAAATTPRTPSPAAPASRSGGRSRPSGSSRKPAVRASANSKNAANQPPAQPPAAAPAPANADKERSRAEDDEADEETLDNLMEEKQAGGASASLTFTARSFRDETSLNVGTLRRRVGDMAARSGLDGAADTALQLLANAVQQRMRRLLEQIAVVAEHRLELYARDARFEPLPAGDAKASFKTLEDADRLEQLRHAKEQEQSLLRAAKSRTKNDDPDQAKLKQKAKELAQAQQEEKKQQAANLTALAAIAGTRKQRKFDESVAAAAAEAPSPAACATPNASVVRPAPTATAAVRSNVGTTPQNTAALSASATLTRLKRATMKDLLFVLEQSPDYSQSKLLYRLALK